MSVMRWGAGVGVLALSCTCGAQGWHVTDHWAIGGEGGWDYLVSDDAAHRLYVTHNARVEVLDTTSGKVVGAVTGMKSTHGVALNPDGKTGYISDGAGNAIVVFDRATLAVKATVAAGTNPDGIAFEPVTGTVWAFNGRSRNVSVMDAATNAVVATIALPGKPEFPQVDGTGRVFVNIEDKNEVVALDAKERKVTGSWALAGCDSPSGMAMDRAGHRLFSVCDGKVMAVSDYAAGKLVGTAAIGDSPDAAGFDEQKHLAFSSNGQGTLSVVDASRPGYPTEETVPTKKGARTMAYEAATGRVYLAVAELGAAPAASAAVPHPRPVVKAGTFEILVVSR